VFLCAFLCVCVVVCVCVCVCVVCVLSKCTILTPVWTDVRGQRLSAQYNVSVVVTNHTTSGFNHLHQHQVRAAFVLESLCVRSHLVLCARPRAPSVSQRRGERGGERAARRGKRGGRGRRGERLKDMRGDSLQCANERIVDAESCSVYVMCTHMCIVSCVSVYSMCIASHVPVYSHVSVYPYSRSTVT